MWATSAHIFLTCILKPTANDVPIVSARIRETPYMLYLIFLFPIDIEPDYERPVEHLYMMVTKTLINCEQNLNVISTTCALVRSEKYGCLRYIDLLTWVPNFESILDTTEICSFNLDHGRQQYCAGGISKSCILDWRSASSLNGRWLLWRDR